MKNEVRGSSYASKGVYTFKGKRCQHISPNIKLQASSHAPPHEPHVEARTSRILPSPRAPIRLITLTTKHPRQLSTLRPHPPLLQHHPITHDHFLYPIPTALLERVIASEVESESTGYLRGRVDRTFGVFRFVCVFGVWEVARGRAMVTSGARRLDDRMG